MARRRARRAALAWVGFGALALGGCHRWETYPTPAPMAAEPSAPRLPAQLRVAGADAPTHVLIDPVVEGDSLVGRERGADGEARRAVALSTIRRLERPRLNPLATAGAILGGMAVWVGGALLLGDLER